MSRPAQLLGIWAFCSVIAALLALEFTRAAYLDGVWLPVSNDSFYHARRILDAALPAGLYQFDPLIHAPEGSWLTWPWGYDWSMAKSLQTWKTIYPAADSMKFLTHVPVYWVFVTSALLIGIMALLNLPTHLIALVMAGFAISPLTQLLHGVGMLDHHFIEYTFVLLTLLSGLWWLTNPECSRRAILLGIVLGIAPAFHNGLFVLQAPVLLTIFCFWLRGGLPSKESALALSSALILATFAILLPADAFRAGTFQFSVLSWFHLYLAALSTLAISCFARFAPTRRSIAGLVALGIALLIPIWQDALGGTAFLTGDILLLSAITEAASPLKMLAGDDGLIDVAGYYSWIGFLAPLLLLIFAARIFRETDPAKLFFAVMTVFGLTLLLLQFRLQYFGSFALLMGWAVLANQYWPTINRKPAVTLLAGVVVLAIAFQPAFANKLFMRFALGMDQAYEDVYPLIPSLTDACAERPGIVLADKNFGHVIRYHTTCSVIANNFLMTKQHEDKIRQMQHLLSLSPEELLSEMPADTRYVLTHMENFFVVRDGEAVLTSTDHLQKNNNRLFFELNARADLPARFKVLAELPLDETRGLTRARIIEILPEE